MAKCIRFADRFRNRDILCARPMRFDRDCEAHWIGRRLTRPDHPSTNGQAERMNRTSRDATVKLSITVVTMMRTHLAALMVACNFARRRKTSRDHAPRRHPHGPDLRAGSRHPEPIQNAGTEHLKHRRGPDDRADDRMLRHRTANPVLPGSSAIATDMMSSAPEVAWLLFAMGEMLSARNSPGRRRQAVGAEGSAQNFSAAPSVTVRPGPQTGSIPPRLLFAAKPDRSE